MPPTDPTVLIGTVGPAILTPLLRIVDPFLEFFRAMEASTVTLL